MMHNRVFASFLLGLSLVALAAPSRAADAADATTRSEAKERFSRGLHLFENGDNGGALAEFKRAYDLIPNRLALYNIALVYASMGKPVEAVGSLEKVLSDPGPLKPEYLARARVSKDEQARRIGQLAVRVNVAAAIEVDGVKVGDAPLAQPLRIAAGEHLVGALAPGYLPLRQAITVAGLAQADLAFDLQPTEARLAHLDVRCPVPGADVLLDGTLVGKTPLAASISVAPGRRVIEIRRAGYASAHRELLLSDGARGDISLDLDESSQVKGERGRLRLAVDEGDVVVTVDGRGRGVYRQAIELPAGPHVVKLEQSGFESLERLTEVPAGDEVLVKVALRPTVETRSAHASRARLFRHLGVGALIGGAIVVGGSTALALWSNGKLSDSETTLSQVQHDAVFRGNGPCDGSYALTPSEIAACDKAMVDARNDVDNYRGLRTGGILGAVGGAVVMGVGVTLWLLGPDPGRYDREESIAATWLPVLVASPQGASLWWRGRF